jgi:putative transposase
MKMSKFTEQQIVFAIKQSESGTLVAEVTRKLGISDVTFYNMTADRQDREKVQSLL